MKRRIDKENLIILLCVCVFAVLLFAVRREYVQTGAEFDSEEVKILSGEFQVSVDGGEPVTVSLPTKIEAKVDAKAGEKIVMTKILSKEELFGNSFMFYGRQARVGVFLDGERMTANARLAQNPFHMVPGSRWYYFRLPENCDNKELRIEIIYTFDNYAGNLPTVYMGTKAAFLYMIVKQAGMALLLGISITFLGIVLIMIGLAVRNKLITKRLCCLGALAIVISVWELLESRITQLFTSNTIVAAYVLFSFYNLIPIFVSALLLTYESIRKKKYMHVLFWLSAAGYVTVLFLQLTGIAYFIQTVFVVHILLILIVLGLAGCFIDWRKNKKENEEDRAIYRAVVLLAGIAGLDMLQYYLDSTAVVGEFSRIGIFVFLTYLGYCIVKQANERQMEEAKQGIYKELAYKDLMTGLANRSAFEEKMQELRKQKGGEDIIVLMADVNNLKLINDNYGHQCGDEAIIATANAMLESFQKNCFCFRIGGDEFCVIGVHCNKNDFKMSCKNFADRIEAVNKEKMYRMAVAFAYVTGKSRDVDECLKEADRQMYQIKADMKKQL